MTLGYAGWRTGEEFGFGPGDAGGVVGGEVGAPWGGYAPHHSPQSASKIKKVGYIEIAKEAEIADRKCAEMGVSFSFSLPDTAKLLRRSLRVHDGCCENFMHLRRLLISDIPTARIVLVKFFCAR